MPEPRIAPESIAEVKAWMAENRERVLSKGINRIDAHYSDDALDVECVSEINTYCQNGSTITAIRCDEIQCDPDLNQLIQEMTEGDGFYQGQQGSFGDFRLLFDVMTPGNVIEHQSYIWIRTTESAEVEVY
jgi:hypothetical protein